MTATTLPVRSRPQAGQPGPLGLARLLRVELRRNTMPWLLPLIAAVFWFDSYRIAATLPPLWNLRAFYILGQGHALIDFAPFVAGVAAWMGSRDGRRGLADLVTTSARSRFAAQFATWAATAIWAVGGYLVFMAATFWALSRSIAWGGPPYWPVAVGAVGVAAFSAAGFTAGAYFPTRFTAPVAAFGGVLACGMSSQIGFASYGGWGLILPTNSNNNYGQDAGIFYQFLPDLPIARVMFLAGIAVALVALLGVRATAGSLRLRHTAAVTAAAGAALAITAIALALTAQVTAYGVVIPALHDAASDRPIPYTPVCGQAAGLPVCVQPAYQPYLADVTAALRPVGTQLTGLPGAPVRAAQVANFFAAGPGALSPAGVGQIARISGRPPVLYLPLGAFNLPAIFGSSPTGFADQIKLETVHAFVTTGKSYGDPAQMAVEAALMRWAGIPVAAQPMQVLAPSPWALPSNGPHPGSTYPAPIAAAATRFAALPAATRHAWLASHLTALRAGQLTLAQLP
ncbi:MAG TPA: hypothetical protein VMH35_28475 [Streptosporangiaceae bacterium]|nr:hypothetical protein [Streptosporangiaceae bacterium]